MKSEYGMALYIISNINNPVLSDDEKASAVYEVIKGSNHLAPMSVTKDQLFDIVEWLFDKAYEVKESDTQCPNN